jgi:hypothetical protein
MMKKSKSGGKSILSGLKTHSPSVDDKSRTPKGGNVKDGALRSEPSKQDATIGPRTA